VKKHQAGKKKATVINLSDEEVDSFDELRVEFEEKSEESRHHEMIESFESSSEEEEKKSVKTNANKFVVHKTVYNYTRNKEDGDVDTLSAQDDAANDGSKDFILTEEGEEPVVKVLSNPLTSTVGL
jgi:hypothetical protein